MTRCLIHKVVLVFAVMAVGGQCAADDVERRALGARPAATGVESRGASAAPAPGVGFVQTAAALGVVLALIGGAAWGVRRFARSGGGGLMGALGPGGRAPSGLLEVLARYPVGRSSTLVLLKLDRRVLLVNQTHGRGTAGAMTALCEIADPEDVASILLKARDAEGDSLARRFQETLSQEGGGYDAPTPRQPIADRRTGQTSTKVAAAAGPGVEAMRGRLKTIRASRGVEVRA